MNSHRMGQLSERIGWSHGKVMSVPKLTSYLCLALQRFRPLLDEDDGMEGSIASGSDEVIGLPNGLAMDELPV